MQSIHWEKFAWKFPSSFSNTLQFNIFFKGKKNFKIKPSRSGEKCWYLSKNVNVMFWMQNVISNEVASLNYCPYKLVFYQEKNVFSL
jgi:hypothetical protein